MNFIKQYCKNVCKIVNLINTNKINNKAEKNVKPIPTTIKHFLK